jgi:hypothetical protein
MRRKIVKQKRLLSLVVVATLITFGSGCASTEPKFVIAPLELPERPILPSVKEKELEPLSEETYKKLEERDRERRQYAEDLEQIIKSTRTEQ